MAQDSSWEFPASLERRRGRPRLVTGLFLGGCLPSCLALVTTSAPEKRRGLGIMVLFTGYGLGATVAGVVPVCSRARDGKRPWEQLDWSAS